MAEPLSPFAGAAVGAGMTGGAGLLMGGAAHTPGRFAPPGAARDPAAVAAQMAELDNLLGGGLTHLSGGQMEMFVRRIHALTRSTPGGTEDFMRLAAAGGHQAEMAGLDRSFGAVTAQSATAFGEAFGERAGPQGFGGLSKREATALDQQLRVGAAASPMANSLGALMAMKENGVELRGPAAQLAAAVERRDQAALNQFAKMTPGQFQQLLQASGVDPTTAATFMKSGKANQAQVQKYGIADLTRGMQREGEVASFMTNNMAGGLAASLAGAGVDRRTATAVAPQAAEAARQALMGMPPEVLDDPAKRNAVVAEAVSAAIGPQAAAALGPAKLKEVAATAVRNLEGALGRSKTFSKFKNLQGLVAMNRGDVQSEANSKLATARADAVATHAAAGVGGAGLAAMMDGVMAAKDDAGVSAVVSRALGGTPAAAGAAAEMAPHLAAAREKTAEYRALHERFRKTKDPAERADLEEKMATAKSEIGAAVTAAKGVMDAKGVAAGGGGGDGSRGGGAPPAASGGAAPAGSGGGAGARGAWGPAARIMDALGGGDRAAAVAATPEAAAPGAGGGPPAAAGDGGAPGTIRITGSLVVRPDGTAEIDAGGSRAGDAPAP